MFFSGPSSHRLRSTASRFVRRSGEFKQRCLALLDAVAESHEPLTITKHGKPVARLVPLESDAETERRILERLRAGDGAVLVDEATFLQPTATLAGWKAD